MPTPGSPYILIKSPTTDCVCSPRISVSQMSSITRCCRWIDKEWEEVSEAEKATIHRQKIVSTQACLRHSESFQSTGHTLVNTVRVQVERTGRGKTREWGRRRDPRAQRRKSRPWLKSSLVLSLLVLGPDWTGPKASSSPNHKGTNLLPQWKAHTYA